MGRGKKTALLITAALMIGGAGFIVVMHYEQAGGDYIFDADSRGRWKAPGLCSLPIPQGGPQQAVTPEEEAKVRAGDFFAEGMRVGSCTLPYFRYLDIPLGKTGPVEEHLARVRENFSAQLPTEDAGKAFQLYEKYLRCETDLAKEYKNWGTPKNPEEMISILRRMQEYRRGKMGGDNADALFGADVKMREYKLRRAALVAEKTFYGQEKERRLHELAKDMWGEEAEAVEAIGRPYDRYREKLDIYWKDLAEMDEGPEKKAFISKFRKELLPPEYVQQLEREDRRQAIQPHSHLNP